MDLFKFIFFSSLEYFSSFVFILVQFRFSLKENATKIVLISLLLSFVSYSFINADLSTISPIIQIVIFLIYIQMVMKVSVINSIIMVFTGYIVYGLVQTCIIAVFSHVGVIERELEAATNTAYLLQVSSCILMLLLSFLNYYFKGGFSFIEARSRFSKKSFTGKNKGFIAFIFIGLFISVFSNIVILESETPPYLLIASVLLVALVILFYFSLRRDEVVD
ncbi:hypothetical protein [Cohnella cholangitidis]|uniref:Uncharacterized protein n=1 Tax=Cohnella cholangitidis TaxID=2598458 RepID=A0A7G5C2U2_9BACL|nr:hypothetical protein [Cohnella cholangitidis]QMV43526.1 hypothetical protein FPL14_21845 [Cohnella cholangitidis]